MIDTLFSEVNINTSKEETVQISTEQFFINFINKLEGFKTKCKNLHWSAPKKNIHVYLDDFLSVISDYQDSIAEDYQGILGHMNPNVIEGVKSQSLNAIDFINEVKIATETFYNNIPSDTCYAGIKSETETFIHNTFKYKYLFELCDIRPY